LKSQLKTKAIIIQSIRWKESSKIVTMYSEALGKIKLIARGAFRKGSPLAGKIETLMLVDAVLEVKESRSINIVKEIDVIDTFSENRLNMKLLPFALSIIEIINQVLDETQPDPVFFNFVLEMENSLKNTNKPEIVLIYFLLKLSSYLGFKPQLNNCKSGDPHLCGDKVFLSINDGKVSCKKCGSNPSHPLVLTRDQYFFLKSLQGINHRRINNYKHSRSDYIEIIQRISRYINFHLDREIRMEALQLIVK